MARWTEHSSKAFSYLTSHSAAPKVVRRARTSEEDDRASDKILRLIESQGWEVHSDPTLINFLATLDIEAQTPNRLRELIAEVLLFCWELDQIEDE
jgi:type III secretion system FlhB-like substrate exporter